MGRTDDSGWPFHLSPAAHRILATLAAILLTILGGIAQAASEPLFERSASTPCVLPPAPSSPGSGARYV
jgi:hypothetical protein